MIGLIAIVICPYLMHIEWYFYRDKVACWKCWACYDSRRWDTMLKKHPSGKANPSGLVPPSVIDVIVLLRGDALRPSLHGGLGMGLLSRGLRPCGTELPYIHASQLAPTTRKDRSYHLS